jgi:hypothetical protein
MDREAWDELVAAHAVLGTLHARGVVLLTQLLERLGQSAAGHPAQTAEADQYEATVTTLVAALDEAMNALEHTINRLEPRDDA